LRARGAAPLIALAAGPPAQVHFDDSRLIPGQIYGVSRAYPALFPLSTSSHMVEVKLQIPAAAAAAASLLSDGAAAAAAAVSALHGAAANATMEEATAAAAAADAAAVDAPRISAWLFEMADSDWRERAAAAAAAAGGGAGGGPSMAVLEGMSPAPPVRLGEWRLSERGEVPVLLEFELDRDPDKQARPPAPCVCVPCFARCCDA
jgi:hypothetical protein